MIFMNDYFKIFITERSYEDDWNEGEVDNTFKTIDISPNMEFKSPQEALKYFYDNYGGEKFGISFDNECNQLNFFIGVFTACFSQHGFKEATEDQINEWREGKITLYNVEYEMIIEKVSAVSKMDMSDIGFEFNE